MPWNTKPLKQNSAGERVPQGFNVTADDYEFVASKNNRQQTEDELARAELAIIKTELAAIKANQTNGEQKVQQSGNIASTRFASRVGAQAPGTIETVAEVTKQSTITSLLFRTTSQDSSIVMLLVFWTGSAWVSYLLPVSPAGVQNNLSYAMLTHSDLFLVKEISPTDFLVQLKAPITVRGFRVQTRNATATDQNITCTVLWSEV